VPLVVYISRDAFVGSEETLLHLRCSLTLAPAVLLLAIRLLVLTT
jgi:hypothetical protein